VHNVGELAESNSKNIDRISIFFITVCLNSNVFSKVIVKDLITF